MFHYCDYESKFDNFSEEEKLQESIRNAELPLDFDFKKDDDLVNAIIRYKSMQDVAALKILNEAKEGLHQSYRVMKKNRQYLEMLLTKIDLNVLAEQPESIEGEDVKTKKDKRADPISKITDAVINIMKLTDQIEPALDTIERLEEKVKKALGNKKEARGGREIGKREDVLPSRELRKQEIDDEGRTVSTESTGRAGIFDDLWK